MGETYDGLVSSNPRDRSRCCRAMRLAGRRFRKERAGTSGWTHLLVEPAVKVIIEACGGALTAQLLADALRGAELDDAVRAFIVSRVGEPMAAPGNAAREAWERLRGV